MGARRITILGGLIMMILTVISGLMAFEIMRQQSETNLSASLKLSMQSRAELFLAGIERHARSVHTVATRPFIAQQMENLHDQPDDKQVRFFLQRAVHSFRKTGFSALAFLDRSGKVVTQAGSFIREPQLALPLANHQGMSLWWQNGLIFRARIAIRDHDQTVGFVLAQVRMPKLSEMLFDTRLLGKTGELAICAASGKSRMKCFPTSLHPSGPISFPRHVNGQRLPMDRALAGESGLVRTRDYRQQEVVATYMPLQDTGLGMVLKIDSNELFEPIKQQLVFVLPAIGILILIGMLLVRLLVSPLIHQVVRSERGTRRANDLLAESEARIRAVFDSVSDGIVVTDAMGTIEAINPAIERIFGYAADELVGQNINQLIPEPQQNHDGDVLQLYLASAESGVPDSAHEMTAVRKNGESFPIDLRVTAMQRDNRRLFVGTLRDITEHKRDQERIAHLANHDALTDLPNRNLLHDRFEQAVAHAKRHPGIKVGMLFLDLDRFKPINDTYGHDVGDQLLIAVAERIRTIVRDEDTIARQGGDEFIIVLPRLATRDDAFAVARKLLARLTEPYPVDSLELTISASIGIALYPDDGSDMEMLLKRSDEAMYAAKMDRHSHISVSGVSPQRPDPTTGPP